MATISEMIDRRAAEKRSDAFRAAMRGPIWFALIGAALLLDAWIGTEATHLYRHFVVEQQHVDQ